MKNRIKKRLTILELEQFLIKEMPPGISCTQIRNHVRKAGLKIDKYKTVSLEDFLKAYTKHKTDDNKNGKPAGIGDGQDPKKQKTVLECKILEAKLQQINRESIPMEEHLSELRTIAGWVNDALAQWVSAVKVLTADARVTGEAERLRDKCRANIESKIKDEI